MKNIKATGLFFSILIFCPLSYAVKCKVNDLLTNNVDYRHMVNEVELYQKANHSDAAHHYACWLCLGNRKPSFKTLRGIRAHLLRTHNTSFFLWGKCPNFFGVLKPQCSNNGKKCFDTYISRACMDSSKTCNRRDWRTEVKVSSSVPSNISVRELHPNYCPISEERAIVKGLAVKT